VADENEEVTVETTDDQTTSSTEGEGSTSAPAGEGAAPQKETPKEKTALDVISEAVTESSAPRRIQPKAEEQSQQDTRPRNADGTFKSETPEEKAAREAAEEDAKLAAETPEQKAERLKNETPEQKAAREAKEAAAKKPDHVNDPIPKELKQATQDRIRSLIDTVKAQNALVEQHGQLFGAIQATGATPNEFAAMVNYMKAVHSTDPVQLRAAYSMIQAELKGIAIKLGEPLYEVNLLRDPANKDLVDEIQAGKLTTNRAHEIALAREQKKVGATARETQTTQQTAESERQAGIADLNKLEDELVARDGRGVYDAKYAILVPMFQETIKTSGLKPSTWRATFTKAYENLKLPAAAAAPPAPAAKQQPLRTKTPAGAGAAPAAPKSALEAINAALDM